MRKALLASIVAVVLIVSVGAVVYNIRSPAQSFALGVYPDRLKGNAIAGERVVFLVSVSSNGTSPAAGIRISAAAPQSAVMVSPETLSQGQVGEVAVIPDVMAVGTNLTLTISAEGGGVTQSHSVDFTVVAGEDWRSDQARQIRDTFVQWLEVNEPGLGVTNQTQWLGTIVSPKWLVVEHYLFFSKDWEMHVYWHVMIPPNDWARIDLRHRFTQSVPSLSFEIPSVNGSLSPHPIPTVNETWR